MQNAESGGPGLDGAIVTNNGIAEEVDGIASTREGDGEGGEQQPHDAAGREEGDDEVDDIAETVHEDGQ